MNIVKAHARTGFYFNHEDNSDKFYRVIIAGSFTVFNWGRVGGPIGQVDIKRHPSPSAAESAADKKWVDKTGPKARDRYERPVHANFDVDLDRIREDKESAKQVVLVMEASTRSTADRETAPTQASQAAAQDKLAAFNQRALDVIELAVSQPAEALTAFADINEMWAALQEDFARSESFLKTATAMVTV